MDQWVFGSMGHRTNRLSDQKAIPVITLYKIIKVSNHFSNQLNIMTIFTDLQCAEMDDHFIIMFHYFCLFHTLTTFCCILTQQMYYIDLNHHKKPFPMIQNMLG